MPNACQSTTPGLCNEKDHISKGHVGIIPTALMKLRPSLSRRANMYRLEFTLISVLSIAHDVKAQRLLASG